VHQLLPRHRQAEVGEQAVGLLLVAAISTAMCDVRR
jgi:hypothetical protein